MIIISIAGSMGWLYQEINFWNTWDSNIVHSGKLNRSVMRTSPCWTCSCHGFPQVTSRHQLGHRVRLGFSRHPCTVSVISPSYDVQMRWSWMRWNHDDALLLVLVPTLETSWIILCDYGKVLHHLFWAFSGFVSCRALSPCCGRPPPSWSPPTLGRLLLL